VPHPFALSAYHRCSSASAVGVHATSTASSHRAVMRSPHAATPCCVGAHATATTDKPLGDEALVQHAPLALLLLSRAVG
jgi:hypothetical protein